MEIIIENIVKDSAKKIVKKLLEQYNEDDSETEVFNNEIQTRAFHEAKDIILNLEYETLNESISEGLRDILKPAWIDQRELKNMKNEELLGYVILTYIKDILFENHGILIEF